MHSNITAIAISSKGFKSKLTPYVNKGTEFTYAPNWADELNMDMESVALSTKSKVHFTFAGNIGKVQNLENIIDAFCSLSNKNQENSQLNIIGDGSNLNNLKQLSCKNPNIVFHGKKERKNMARYYKSSDFLIVSLIDKPIFSVTVPAKIQTYIAAKKPILGFINGETANIIRKNNLGLCANPENIIAIAKVFEKCIGMSKEDKAMHTMNCKKLLQTTFNKDRVIKRLEKTLLEK